MIKTNENAPEAKKANLLSVNINKKNLEIAKCLEELRKLQEDMSFISVKVQSKIQDRKELIRNLKGTLDNDQ